MVERTILALLGVVIFFGGVTAQPRQSYQAENAMESSARIQIAPKSVREPSDAHWESSFFKALEERTKQLGLASLSTMRFPDQDLEVRFWYDARPDIINGVVIRRSDGRWSALGIRQVNDRWPSPVRQEALGPPKSGWGAAWKALLGAGILTLPDGYETRCASGVLDGGGFVVETIANQKYRTYRYGNPQFGKCDEAKRLLSIESIIADEFRLQK